MADCETDWSRDVLEHIVALLFALAGLADLAAGVPAVRRRQVLEILSHGEAEARAFLTGSDAPAWAGATGEAEEAASLAARLRLLALLLCAFLTPGLALPGAAGPQACRASHRISGPAVRRLEVGGPRAPDTS